MMMAMRDGMVMICVGVMVCIMMVLCDVMMELDGIKVVFFDGMRVMVRGGVMMKMR